MAKFYGDANRRGQGELDGRPIDGTAGQPRKTDEFFVSVEAAKRSVQIKDTGAQPLVAFVRLATKVFDVPDASSS